MKTQMDKTQEQQSVAAPKVLKEHSTGGMATIMDNRPSTVYQRKLRETMNAHAVSKALPVQRKAPKGSSRFQQIATAMGEQHGVDTSGLAATHNSSFPSKLNAEATIQGNKIHFAPGMDTNYNIRHEVAHAIDNTINGTPKGDQIVNGQNIDTTREETADRMAKAPLRSFQSQSLPVQRKLKNAGTETIQLKAKIDKNKLNVIGENHPESDKRRDDERALAESYFSKPAFECYWREHQIFDEFEDDTRLYGDPPEYVYQFNVAYLLGDLITSEKAIEKADEYLKHENPDMSNLGTMYLDIRSGLMFASHHNGAAHYSIYPKYESLKKNKTDLEHAEDKGRYMKSNHPDEIRLDKAVYEKINNLYEEVKANYGKREPPEYWVKHISEMLLQVREIIGEIQEYLNSYDYIKEVIEGKERSQYSEEIKDKLMDKRDRGMFAFADRSNKKGIWKIGQKHVEGIEKKYEKPFKFNLISQKDFNSIFKWWWWLWRRIPKFSRGKTKHNPQNTF